jgi:cytochrome b
MPNLGNQKNIVLIWDFPVRAIHWLLVLCFVGAYLTAEDDGLRLLHVTLGYTLAALMAVRIFWGFVGSRHARFTSFIKGPEATWKYLMSVLTAKPQQHTGHNPLGALAILGLMFLGLGVSFTGWCALHQIGGEWNEELHEAIAEGMLVVVAIHVLSVIAASFLHHENLVKAMVNGCKTGKPNEKISNPHPSIAFLVVMGVIGFWGYQYTHSSNGGIDGDAIIFNHNAGDSGEDDADDETYANKSNECRKFKFQC